MYSSTIAYFRYVTKYLNMCTQKNRLAHTNVAEEGHGDKILL